LKNIKIKKLPVEQLLTTHYGKEAKELQIL